MEPTQDAKAISPPAVLEAHSRRQIEAQRYRGYRGGFISRHRSLLFSPFNPAKVVSAVALLIVILALWYLALGGVTHFWGWVIDFWGEVLGVGGVDGLIDYSLGPIQFSIPSVYVPSALPTHLLWWLGIVMTLLLTAISLLIPRRYLPFAYFLRLVAFFQGCSQIFFAFWPEAFPYGASGYIHTVLIATLMLISVIPIVLACSYYLFDFSLGRKIALTLIMMGHLVVMVPLQFVVHMYIIYHLSLLFLPLMFFVVGLPLNVFVFISFYAWGFSWRNLLTEQEVQWKARHRFV